MHIYVTKWCIVGYGTGALWDLWDDSIVGAMMEKIDLFYNGRCFVTIYEIVRAWIFPIQVTLKSRKFHFASDKTVHHFVTEMCRCVHISVTKLCIVGYGLVRCGICATGLLFCQWYKLFLKGLGCSFMQLPHYNKTFLEHSLCYIKFAMTCSGYRSDYGLPKDT